MINKILLIDIEDITRDGKSALTGSMGHYPIGLMYLASSVSSIYPNIEIKIFHTFTSMSPLRDLIELLHVFQPDLIGLRALSMYKNDFNLIAETIKKEAPEKYLIAGGPYPSISFEEILLDKLVDIVVIGEGEITFREVIEALQVGNDLPTNISGTAIVNNDRVIKNQARPLISNVDSIPFPDYSLIDLNKYSNAVNQTFIGKDYASLFSSRGCPFQCFYCHKLFGKTIRRRSPENIVAEMKEHYNKRNIKNFIFLDDVFNVPLNAAKQVLKLISQTFSDIHINFPNGLRADHIDDEFITLLEACGTIQITLAIESATHRLQQYMGKNLDIEFARSNIEKLSRKFIITVMYIIGFPTETLSEAEETIAFAQQLEHVTQPVLNTLRVYEDSPILKILTPSPGQMKLISNQSLTSHSERVFYNGKFSKPTFYGDYFSRELVPLTSDNVFRLNIKWIHNVINNSRRIANSYKVMRNFISDNEIVSFYKHFLNNENFEFSDLMRMMKS